MIEFIYHDSLEREIDRLEKNKLRGLRQNGFKRFERLCAVQFHPTSPQQIIGPGKLHRVTQNDVWAMWKVELIVPNVGLKPNQYPRVWFAHKGAIIAFLCIATHMENYDNAAMKQLALERVSSIF